MTREQRRLAREIFAKAMFISEYTPADCFVNYSPHVDGLEVRVYPEGWSYEASDEKQAAVLLRSHNCEADDMIRALNAMDEYISNAIVDTNKWMEEQ